ncbi:unnamed protein product, partial [Citrullus colocynthis]
RNLIPSKSKEEIQSTRFPMFAATSQKSQRHLRHAVTSKESYFPIFQVWQLWKAPSRAMPSKFRNVFQLWSNGLLCGGLSKARCPSTNHSEHLAYH